MEFNEKLQELRKQRKLTQEQLAEALYVSRTAISKWESGRGYPSIDSLKEISRFFSVSIDELLSSEELLTVAQDDNKNKIQKFRDLVFGLLDCSVALYLFLPFFGQRAEGVIQEVSLLSLTEVEPYIKIPYLIVVFGLILCGILTLALQNSTASFWINYKGKISLGLSAIASLFFMMSTQPYAASFTFLFLVIKALMLIKWA
ncbi:MAG: helix-turn-helix domain-containing protein [Coprococcus sp.]